MIFVTGDTHGAHDLDKIGPSLWPEGQKLTRDDYLVICGDFGAIWSGDARDRELLGWYEAQPWTTLWLDGNHENHDLIDELPQSRRFGGRVHTIDGCPHVIHLMRGEVYDLPTSADETVRAFVMGGAPSIDRYLRTEGVSWWPRELPDYEEYDNAEANLAACDWSVDYVFTHELPSDARAEVLSMGESPFWDDYDEDPQIETGELDEFLQEIDNRLNKDRLVMWYAGHHHMDREIDDQHCVLYQEVVELGGAPFGF